VFRANFHQAVMDRGKNIDIDGCSADTLIIKGTDRKDLTPDAKSAPGVFPDLVDSEPGEVQTKCNGNARAQGEIVSRTIALT
jgi:hypothetical protein